jgi:hypothetical protein
MDGQLGYFYIFSMEKTGRSISATRVHGSFSRDTFLEVESLVYRESAFLILWTTPNNTWQQF